METTRNSRCLRLFLAPLVFCLISLLLCQASASSGSDYGYGAHPRFVCTPIPADADPSCFPTAGPSVGAPAGPGGPGHQSSPPAGWWGASEEAKATILNLRESLVRQKETILDQRETIRELTAKLTLCEGFGQGGTPHDEDEDDDDHHGTASHSHRAGADGPHPHTDHGHHGNQQGHHGNSNFIPDSPHNPSVGGHRSDGGHRSGGGGGNRGKNKHVTPGATSSPEQMERMLQALKERLDNLQKRNTSITYSSSLRELLQRKISALEQQLHRQTLHGPEHHHDDSRHTDDRDHRGDDDDDHDHHHPPTDGHTNDHKEDRDDRHPDDGRSHGDRHDDGHRDDGHDARSGHEDRGDGQHRDDDHHRDAGRHRDDGQHYEDEDDDDHHSNEADDHGYLPHTGYRAPGARTGFHTDKLETVLNQLQLTGSHGMNVKSPDAFQISFPMRSNYMYGQVKRTLLQEIFALTLCLWMKAAPGHSLGTPFSYSAPGQANELVLIEWGNNPLELLVDDKAVTLPLSVNDGKWHHVCVTWTTRDGEWEAYQDGVQRGSGINLSPWRPIKPGGVFILGQEQDTLGGRFDATQSFVGEMSDLHMWSHVLSSSDIYSLASCGSYLRGDVIAWSDTEVELHGGVARYPFDPCH